MLSINHQNRQCKHKTPNKQQTKKTPPHTRKQYQNKLKQTNKQKNPHKQQQKNPQNRTSAVHGVLISDLVSSCSIFRVSTSSWGQMFKLRQTQQLCSFSGSHTMASKLHSNSTGWVCPFPLEGSLNEWKWRLALCTAFFSPHYITVADQTLTSRSAPALTLKWTESAVSCHHNLFSKCEAGHGSHDPSCSIHGPNWLLNIPWLFQGCVWDLYCCCFPLPQLSVLLECAISATALLPVCTFPVTLVK